MSNTRSDQQGHAWVGGEEIVEARHGEHGEDFPLGYAEEHHDHSQEFPGSEHLGYGGAYGQGEEFPEGGDGYGQDAHIPSLDPDADAPVRSAEAEPKKKNNILGFHPYVVYTGCAVCALLIGAIYYTKNMAAPPAARPHVAHQVAPVQQPMGQPLQAQPIPQQAQVLQPMQPQPVAQAQPISLPQAPIPQTYTPGSEERFSRIEGGLADEAAKIASDESNISALNNKMATIDGRVAVLESRVAAASNVPAKAVPPAQTAPPHPVSQAAPATPPKHRSHAVAKASGVSRVPSAADEQAVLQAMDRHVPHSVTRAAGAPLNLDAVSGKTAWLSEADGESKPYTVNSTVPGWGRVIQIRRNLSDASIWEVVTEKGVASSGRE